jgi:SAM-dependent methyltransferase
VPIEQLPRYYAAATVGKDASGIEIRQRSEQCHYRARLSRSSRRRPKHVKGGTTNSNPDIGMNRTASAMTVIGLARLEPQRHWLHAHGIPQRIEERLTRSGLSLEWVAYRPSRHPHQAYEPVPSANWIEHVWIRTVWGARQVAKRIVRRLRFGNSARRFARVFSEDQVLREVLAEARSKNAARFAVIRDNQAALLPEAVTLAFGSAPDADAVCCSQLDGLLPTIVNTDWLETWLARDPQASVDRLEQPGKLSAFGRISDLQLVDDVDDGAVRCWPLDPRERTLLRYWEEHANELAKALRDQLGERPSRQRLTSLIRSYRCTVAAALPTYSVTGTFDGLQELRRQMVTTQKPVIDYFVIATHFGRFLQAYAGLRPSSRVLDIGCSWGYLAFALANFLKDGGAYLGIEVQQAAVRWAQEHLAWLGENFGFAYLDIRNDYYHPNGTIARGEVALPVENGWADVIVLGSVFTHMKEDGIKGYLREFRRILRPGGTVAFSYFDSTSFWSGEQVLIADQQIPDRETVYSRSRVEEMLAEAGLTSAREPVNMRHFDRTDYQTWYFATPRSR